MRKLAGSFFNRHAVEVRAPLRLLVDVWFQNYFTALTGLLFTFPSRYWFTIDLLRYLALPVSSGGFIQAIRVSDYSRTNARESYSFRVRDRYPLGSCFPAGSATNTIAHSPSINGTRSPYNPASIARDGLGFSPFARRYSGNTRIPVPRPTCIGRETEMSCWFLFLSVLRCFTSRGELLQHPLKMPYEVRRVSPFGDFRIEACSSAPRNFSQTRCVLHRSQESRHPPHTLQTSTRKLENHITFSVL